MSMRMINSCQLSWCNLIYFWFELLYKFKALNRWINRNIFLGFNWRIDINPNNSFCPLFEFGHFLTRKLVSIARNMDSAIIINNKLSIFVSPTINFEPLFFVPDWLSTFDIFLLESKRQILEPLHTRYK